MNVLVLAPGYPYPGHPFSGIFNERSVQTLRKLCSSVEVVAPRPYVPPFFSFFVPRWKAYAAAARHEIRSGVPVHRPSIPVVPRIGTAFWHDRSASLWTRQITKKLHRKTGFDAILSFDLVAGGGIAWRTGQDLGIPASGWATGGDLRVSASSSHARVVVRALQHLDVIFYQSYELREKAADLLGISVRDLSFEKHVVLPRGIPEPPVLPVPEARKQLREQLGIRDDKILVLSIGRITREKGIFELLDAISLATKQDPRITCVQVGSVPAFDETRTVEKQLAKTAPLHGKMKILPSCDPDKVWGYLSAADIFAFASHNEGMPNSLLEALAMAIPAVAFAIPAVKELEANTAGLLTVTPFDSGLFAQAILRLASNPDERITIGQSGKARVFDRFLARKNMAVAVEKLSEVAIRFKDSVDRPNVKMTEGETSS